MGNRLIDRFDGGGKIFDVFEASKLQCKVVLGVASMILTSEIQFSPSRKLIALSALEPFNEEMELDCERLANWLSRYGLLPVPRE